MAKATSTRRVKNKDNARRAKKKISVLIQDKIEYVDYKDVNLLRKFISDRAKIRARRVTGNNTQQQAEIAKAIKVAREMALIPYATRVTTQRSRKDDRGDRGDRRGRSPRDAEATQNENVDETTTEATEGVEATEVEMTEEATA